VPLRVSLDTASRAGAEALARMQASGRCNNMALQVAGLSFQMIEARRIVVPKVKRRDRSLADQRQGAHLFFGVGIVGRVGALSFVRERLHLEVSSRRARPRAFCVQLGERSHRSSEQRGVRGRSGRRRT
jgi:hypothetical protein